MHIRTVAIFLVMAVASGCQAAPGTSTPTQTVAAPVAATPSPVEPTNSEAKLLTEAELLAEAERVYRALRAEQNKFESAGPTRTLPKTFDAYAVGLYARKLSDVYREWELRGEVDVGGPPVIVRTQQIPNKHGSIIALDVCHTTSKSKIKAKDGSITPSRPFSQQLYFEWFSGQLKIFDAYGKTEERC